MPTHWINEEEWCRSKSRTIDDATLCDLLRVIEYEAERTAALDELGIQDSASSNDALCIYVLDALGVPAENTEQYFKGEHERFSKKCLFSREWFEELFYSEYPLKNL
ncbi:MAG: hypothetical protein JKY52_09050 [Flavobacteriales bacterium]|nr:hypothetical protein [Flavobacteriales bacterium]